MIIPSIASAKQLKIYEELNRFSSDQPMHIDIEDGNFIPNITFGIKTVNEIAKLWKGPLDAHLLVTNPVYYIRQLFECGIGRIAFHIEATEYPLDIIRGIKKLGMVAGLALNFKTPLCSLEMFIEDIDYVIVMTSEPDNSEQRFHALACERIKSVRKILPYGKGVWADGGITAKHLGDICKAGADTVIIGRSVFNAEDPKKELESMNKIFELKQKKDRNR